MLIVSFTFLCTHVSVFRAIIKGWRDRPGPDMGKTAQLQRERVGAGMTADACMHTMVSGHVFPVYTLHVFQTQLVLKTTSNMHTDFKQMVLFFFLNFVVHVGELICSVGKDIYHVHIMGA